jgi:peptidoglycan-associated lipoprotein
MTAVMRLMAVLALAVLVTACGGKNKGGAGGASTADDAGTGVGGDGATSVGVGADGGLTAEEMAAMGLNNVFYFDFDQSTLSEEIRARLDAFAAKLRDSGVMIRLEGHADERGTREYNLALGERRANAIKEYLVLQGIDRSRIESISYGEEKPVELGQDESAWSRNRRVELK